MREHTQHGTLMHGRIHTPTYTLPTNALTSTRRRTHSYTQPPPNHAHVRAHTHERDARFLIRARTLTRTRTRFFGWCVACVLLVSMLRERVCVLVFLCACLRARVVVTLVYVCWLCALLLGCLCVYLWAASQQVFILICPSCVCVGVLSLFGCGCL